MSENYTVTYVMRLNIDNGRTLMVAEEFDQFR